MCRRNGGRVDISQQRIGKRMAARKKQPDDRLQEKRKEEVTEVW